MKLLKLMIAFSLITMQLPAYADSSKNCSADEKEVHMHNQKPNNTNGNRPRCPSIQLINCRYSSNGNLFIEFVYPEGNCQLTITDVVSSEVISCQFNSEVPFRYQVGITDSPLI